jgi:hypothetical protein
VAQEEDIFAQVMVEEDLFPEDDGYDVVLSNAVFISPATKPLPTPPAQKRSAAAASAAKKTVSVGDGRDDHAQEEDLEEEAFFSAGSHPETTLGGGNMSTSCPQIPRLSLVPQRSLADQSEAAVAGVDAHHHHHHGGGGDDDGEERGRKVKSPRGEGVDVLGMADDEQVHENHREAAAPARRRLPPGAVGYGQIVPTHFELRKTGGPHSVGHPPRVDNTFCPNTHTFLLLSTEAAVGRIGGEGGGGEAGVHEGGAGQQVGPDVAPVAHVRVLSLHHVTLLALHHNTH